MEEIDKKAWDILREIRRIKHEQNMKSAYGNGSAMHFGLTRIKIYELIIQLKEVRKRRFE